MQQGVTGSGTVVEDGGLFDEIERERERELVPEKERGISLHVHVLPCMYVQVCD